MARAFYVPAGTSMWTSFTSPLSFSHLDIHLKPEKVVQFLSPSLGRSAALDALRRPAEVQEARDLETLARLLVDEVTTPARHDLYVENRLTLPPDSIGAAGMNLLGVSSPMPLWRSRCDVSSTELHRSTGLVYATS